jgi:hypothetical protein
MMRSAILFGAMSALVLASGMMACADERAPNIYVTAGPYWDLEDDAVHLDFGIKLAGRSTVSPDIGLYDDKLLVGATYNVLGKRSELKGLYGGPGAFWYDDHWGGSLTLGTHLTREWIVEASYRVTPDWDGGIELSVGYGFNWSLLGQ